MVEFDKPVQIGELAKITGTSIRMIRYFEKNGLISVAERKPRGYRLFTLTHVTEIQWVKRMQELEFSLAEVKKLRDVESSGLPGWEKVKTLEAIFHSREAEIDRQIAELQSVRRQLKRWGSLRMPPPGSQ